MAPAAGLEPATYWLTANRSTTELCRNNNLIIHEFFNNFKTFFYFFRKIGSLFDEPIFIISIQFEEPQLGSSLLLFALVRIQKSPKVASNQLPIESKQINLVEVNSYPRQKFFVVLRHY